jgi:hypothetical protein
LRRCSSSCSTAPVCVGVAGEGDELLLLISAVVEDFAHAKHDVENNSTRHIKSERIEVPFYLLQVLGDLKDGSVP